MCDCQQNELVSELKRYCDEQTRLHRDMMNMIRRSIPSYVVRERQWLSSNGTQITLQPQSHNLELITSMIIYCTSTSVLQLGPERTWPLAAMTTPLLITNIGIMLNENDQRILTQVTPGAMALELMGTEMADRGPF